jgi:sugar phosphate isomerase/epimerase
MKLGCVSWVYRGAKPSPPYDESIKAISQMGFKATSLWASQPKILEEYYTKNTVRGLRELLESSGLELLEFTSINSDLTSLENEASKRGWEMYQKAVEVAKDLGTSIINLLGHYPPLGISMMDFNRLWVAPVFKTKMPTDPDFWEKTWENYVDVVGRCVDLAAENGLRVTLEPHPFMIVSNSDALLRLFDAIKSESLGITFDTALSKSANEISEIVIFKMGRRIFNVHVSDNLGNITSPLHLTPGKGSIYWEGVLKTLKIVGYNGFLELELMQMISDEETFREENQRAIDYMKEAGKRVDIPIE